MSRNIHTSNRHASHACPGIVMGAGSVITRTGVPQEMWDTSSAIRETFRLNGQRNVLMMLDKLDKFKKLMKPGEFVMNGKATIL